MMCSMVTEIAKIFKRLSISKLIVKEQIDNIFYKHGEIFYYSSVTV